MTKEIDELLEKRDGVDKDSESWTVPKDRAILIKLLIKFYHINK